MSHSRIVFRIGRLLAVYFLGVLLLIGTDPQRLPSVVLIAPFIIFFVAIYMTAMELLRATSGEAKGKYSVAAIHPRRLAFLVAMVPTLLLVLNSIGQLTFIDLVITLAILVVGYFYILRSVSPANRG